VAIKVDCDTEVGTREGVPRLLEILSRRGIAATFFFTLGPDRSGLAVRRAFTRRGFVSKMVRSRGLALYGWRTALSGTLLPARPIGKRCEGQMRSVVTKGHEAGVHGWDHVRWQDRLPRMTEREVREESGRAHAEFARIFGAPARCSAAPGWAVDARALAVQEERGLLYASDTRGGSPFFPTAGGRVFRTLEIPTTLPTLDETLAWPALASDDAQRRFFRGAVTGTEVLTVHAEVEGGVKRALFAAILDDWIAAGVSFPSLSRIAREWTSEGKTAPVREVTSIRLPGRSGEVASGWPELAAAESA
jgi:undecaprenyl phosphate-alpha-L-ara4FN deformylase